MDAPSRAATGPPPDRAESASPDGDRTDPGLEPFDSLDDAMRVMGIPLENHRFIRQFTAAIGIAGYFRTSSYIKAVRSEEGPALQIAFGFTNGFVSRDEAVAASGNGEPWPSARGTGLWGLWHPVHGHENQTSSPHRGLERDYGTCPKCFTSYSASGSCLCEA